MSGSASLPPPRRHAGGALPNVLIAGAQKCGTTTLHRMLESHPLAFTPPRRQEIHFFDHPRHYPRGLDWYARLFAGWRGEPALFQTSPLYLYEPAAAERIAAALPDARLIFILRHPVDRAYSHYRHEVRLGSEPLPFEEALRREPERIAGGFDRRRRFSYLDRGRYAGQLRRFLDLFPKGRLLLLTQDQLRADPASVGGRLEAFLGIAAGGWAAGLTERSWHFNPGKVPRIPALQRWSYPLRPVPIVGALAVRLLERLNFEPGRYPPMDPALRRRLEKAMAPEIEALIELTGLPVEGWLAPAPEGAADG